MNHIYKTIWNKSKNAFDVVSEAVSSKGKATSGSKVGAVEIAHSVKGFFAVLTPIAAMLFVQSVAANTQVASGSTRVFNANNGVQVIDIAKANNAGVSHNRYIQYNVDKTGQVLNNAVQKPDALSIMTKLAGNIQTNKNLDKSARVIINEVTGANRSQLSGHIEIAGGKSDLVIANPYGITCNGCGFINTDKATLTTGTPRIGSDGSLQGFNVRGGDITINGTGLNGKDPYLLQLLSRQLKLDGQINANQLEVVTGTYNYDSDTKKVTSVAVSGSAPTYAIDSTALGGIYADRISLISNENGVGVKMLGNVAATAQDFTLTASGKIELNNKVSAKENISIQNGQTTTRQVDVTGSLTAKNVEIGSASNNKLNLNVNGGTVYASNNLSANVNQLTAKNAGLQADATNKINAATGANLATTEVLAGQALHIEGTSLTTSGTTKLASSKQAIDIKTQGNTNLGNGIQVIAQKNVNINAQGNVTLGTGQIKSNANDLNITADNINLSATSAAVNSNLIANQALNILKSASLALTNKATLNASSALISGQVASKTQNIATSGKLTVADGSVLTATGDTQISAGDLDLVGDLYANNATLKAKNNLITSANSLISTQANTTLNATNVQLAGEQYANQLNILATKDLNLKNTGELIAQNHQLQANQINVEGQIKADSANLNATTQLNLLKAGAITSKNQLIVNSATTNVNGNISAKTVEVNNVDKLNITNTSNIVTDGQAKFNSGSISVAGKVTSGALSLNATDVIGIEQIAQLKTLQALDVQAKDINIKGQLTALNTGINASSNLNVEKSSVLLNQNNANLKANNITIDGALYSKNSQIEAANNLNLNKTAELISNDAINLKANQIESNALINSSNATLNALDQLKLNATSETSIVNKLTLQANQASLLGEINAKDLSVNTKKDLSSTGSIVVQNNAVLSADKIDVSGEILAKNLTLDAKLQLNLQKSAELLANELIDLDAGNLEIAAFLQAKNIKADATQNLVLTSDAFVYGVNGADLTAANNVNLNGNLYSKNSTITAGNEFNLSENGVLVASANANINANVINSNGWIEALNTELTSKGLLNISDTNILNVAGDARLTSTQDQISIGGYITAKNIYANAINSAFNTKVSAILNASNNIVLNANQWNNDANIFANKNLTTSVKNIVNKGTLQADQIFFNQLTNLNNENTIFSNKNFLIAADSLKNSNNSNSALFRSNENLTIKSNKDFENNGKIIALNELNIQTNGQSSLINNHILESGQKTVLTTDKLLNNSTAEILGSIVEVNAKSVTNNGEVVGYKDVLIQNNNAFNNAKNAAIQAGNTINILSTGKISNEGSLYADKLISLGSSLTGSVGIDNLGTINTFANDDTAKVALDASKITNNSLISSSFVDIKTSTLTNNGGLYSLSLDLRKKSGETNLSLINTGSDSNANGIYVFKGLTADLINKLDNSGYLFINTAKSVDSDQFKIAEFINSTTANSIFNNTKIDNKLSNQFINEGNLNLQNDSELNAKGVWNKGKIELISSNINVDQKLTNDVFGNVYGKGVNKIKANNLDNLGLIFGNEGSTLNLEADVLTNNFTKGTNGELYDAGIISLGTLNLNANFAETNTINNKGSIYSKGKLTIGNKSTTDFNNLMNSKNDVAIVSGKTITTGGSIVGDGGIDIFANNFKNNYQIKASTGDINIEVANNFFNETTYYGQSLVFNNIWELPIWSYDTGWKDSGGRYNESEQASNGTYVYFNQIARQGDKNDAYDDGVNAGWVTETWKLKSDLSALKETSNENYDVTFNKIKAYLDNVQLASINADAGNVTINLDNSGSNTGAQISAAGGNVKIDVKSGSFYNQGIQLVNQDYTVQYLVLTDAVKDDGKKWDVGAVISTKSTGEMPNTNNIDDDQYIDYVAHYFDKAFSGPNNVNTSDFFTQVVGEDYVKGLYRHTDSVKENIIEFRKFLSTNAGTQFGVKVGNSENKVVLNAKILSTNTVNISAETLKNLEYAEKAVVDETVLKENLKDAYAQNRECKNNSSACKVEESTQTEDVGGIVTVKDLTLTGENLEDNQENLNSPVDDTIEPTDVNNADGIDLIQDSEQKAQENNEEPVPEPVPEVELVRPNYPMDRIPAPNLTIPQTRYSEYVQSKDTNSLYLVERNPLYGVGSDVIGSSYLLTILEVDPDKILKRLGDDSYEMNLIQQQLDLMGSRTAAALKNESQLEMIERLFTNAAEVSSTLNLSYGEPLTADQLKNLDSDIVWMVKKEVNGQTVLVPQVYLTTKTIESINTKGSVIAGNVATVLDAAEFTNANSTIGGGFVDIKTLGDINNIGGLIKGEDVSLESKYGSINNITEAYRAGGKGAESTTLGEIASIQSKGMLLMDAAKDINNIGAQLKAEGASQLKAGGDINIKAIEIRTSSTENIKRGDIINQEFDENGKIIDTTKAIGNGHKVTSSVTHVGSDVQLGDSAAFISGGNTLISGSDVNVKGQLYAKTGGDFILESVQDSVETTTKSSRSGFGVGGGLYGTQSQTTRDFDGTNKASNLNVGSIVVESDNKVVIQGSNINIKDKDSVSIISGTKGVDILDGKDEKVREKETVTTTFLKVTQGPSQTSAGAKAGADASSGSNADGSQASAGAEASASASAEAAASGSGSLRLMEHTVEKSVNISEKSVASNINSEGSLLIQSSEGTATVRGSNVDVKGALGVQAKDIQILAGQNKEYSSHEVKQTSIGVYAEGSAKAEAGADANAKANAQASKSSDPASASASANAGASAKAQAEGMATFGALHETQSTTSSSLTHTNSSLKSGGDMSFKADNTVLFHGASVDAGNNLDIRGKDIINKAVKDEHTTTQTSSSHLAGYFIGAKAEVSAQASAHASAEAGKSGVGASASASATVGGSAEVSQGVRTVNTESSQTDQSTIYHGNEFKAGGNMTRVAENSIFDEATQVDVKGNFAQKATTITDNAVYDTFTTTKSSQTHEATIGVSVGGSGSAGANYEAKVGKESSASESKHAAQDPSLNIGVSARYDGSIESSTDTTTVAKTSSFTAGGSIYSESTDDTTLTGTQFKAGKDVVLVADKLDYKAAMSSSSGSESKQEFGAGANAKFNIAGQLESAGAEANYGNSSSSYSSTTANVGGIEAGGNIQVVTKEGASFEGTQFNAGQDTIIVGDKVDFKAAQSTFSSKSTSHDASIGGEVGFAGGKADSISGNVGYSNKNESKSGSTSTVSNLNSGGSVTVVANTGNFEGTNIASGGDTTLVVDNLNFSAARDTYSSSSSNVGVSLGAGGSKGKAATPASGNTPATEAKGGSGSGSLSVGYGQSKSESDTAVVGSISTGGQLNVVSKSATFEGTNLASGGDTNLFVDTLDFKAARSTSSSSGMNVGVDLSASGTKGTPAQTTTATPTGPVITPPTPQKAPAGATPIKQNAVPAATSTPATTTTAATGSSGSGSVGANYGQSQSTSDTAVVGSVNSGGKLNVVSKSATFEGTNLASVGDTNLFVDTLDFKAARSTSSSSGMNVGVDLSASGTKGTPAQTTTATPTGPVITPPTPQKAPAGATPIKQNATPAASSTPATTATAATGSSGSGSVGASYGQSQSTSDTAVVGSINSGGKLNVVSKSATFEGTNLASVGDTNLIVDTLDFKAAISTSSSSGMNVGVDLSASGTKGTPTPAVTPATKAPVITPPTPQAAPAGATPIKQSATPTTTSTPTAPATPAEPAKTGSGSGSAKVSFGMENSKSNQASVGSISSTGGTVNIVSKDATFEGTQFASMGDTNISAKNVTFNAVQSTSSGTGFGINLGATVDVPSKNVPTQSPTSAPVTKQPVITPPTPQAAPAGSTPIKQVTNATSSTTAGPAQPGATTPAATKQPSTAINGSIGGNVNVSRDTSYQGSSFTTGGNLNINADNINAQNLDVSKVVGQQNFSTVVNAETLKGSSSGVSLSGSIKGGTDTLNMVNKAKDKLTGTPQQPTTAPNPTPAPTSLVTTTVDVDGDKTTTTKSVNTLDVLKKFVSTPTTTTPAPVMPTPVISGPIIQQAPAGSTPINSANPVARLPVPPAPTTPLRNGNNSTP